MSLSSLEYLRHILDEAAYLTRCSQGLSREEFLQDDTLERAFVRSLEIIGEATKNVSAEIRLRYSHVDWRAMAAMRDRLIHGYFGVDYNIVWDVVVNRMPALQKDIQRIIQEETR